MYLLQHDLMNDARIKRHFEGHFGRHLIPFKLFARHKFCPHFMSHAGNDSVGWLPSCDVCCLSHMTYGSSLVMFRHKNDSVRFREK